MINKLVMKRVLKMQKICNAGKLKQKQFNSGSWGCRRSAGQRSSHCSSLIPNIFLWVRSWVNFFFNINQLSHTKLPKLWNPCQNLRWMQIAARLQEPSNIIELWRFVSVPDLVIDILRLNFDGSYFSQGQQWLGLSQFGICTQQFMVHPKFCLFIKWAESSNLCLAYKLMGQPNPTHRLSP